MLQRSWNRDARAPRRLLIGPVVHRIDAEILLRKLVDGIHRAAQVRAGQQHGRRSLRARVRLDHRDRK